MNKGLPEELLTKVGQPTVSTTTAPLSNQEMDPAQMIMMALSEIQMTLIAYETKVSELQRHVVYLLSKDKEYMEAVAKMEAEIKQQQEAGENEQGTEK